MTVNESPSPTTASGCRECHRTEAKEVKLTVKVVQNVNNAIPTMSA